MLSHSGIAVSIDEDGRPRRDGPANRIASALADNLRYDVGGIRWDRFEEFWPSRDFYTIAMPDVLREQALDYLDGRQPAVRIRSYSDAPPGSGLGSSSTLVVSLVTALAAVLLLTVAMLIAPR